MLEPLSKVPPQDSSSLLARPVVLQLPLVLKRQGLSRIGLSSVKEEVVKGMPHGNHEGKVAPVVALAGKEINFVGVSAPNTMIVVETTGVQ